MDSTAKIAKLLRTPERVILDLEKKMGKATGRKGVIDKIIRENEHKIRQTLIELGFGTKKPFFDIKAEQVHEGLIKKARETDQAFLKHFHQPDFSTTSGCRSVINTAKEISGNFSGFYLKESKAKELLRLNPPQQIMKRLGYGSDIDKILINEDVFEIFSALRFVEDSNWLNNVFFKPYRDLKKEDFEERGIRVMILPEKWKGIGQEFLGKKLHHMSHLKELGVVFAIPLVKQRPAETIYFFFMTLHYIYEVDWHSRLFKMYSKQKNFAGKMISALKVGVTKEPLPDKGGMSCRIVPKYLAKNDINDFRLSEPHISPEAWHYTEVISALQKFSQRFPELGLDFWQGLDVVAEYFPFNSLKKDVLVSFDLFDSVISLLQETTFESRFSYHQQEALWNKIFIEYMGEGTIDKLLMENLDKGYVIL